VAISRKCCLNQSSDQKLRDFAATDDSSKESIEQPSVTSPLRLPFFRQSPFRAFRQTLQGGFVVDTFVEMFEMEIVEKRGVLGD